MNGNIEQYFSRAGLLTDPHMHPEYLGKLTSIGVNKAAYKPPAAEIYNKYMTKSRTPRLPELTCCSSVLAAALLPLCREPARLFQAGSACGREENKRVIFCVTMN